MVEHPLKIAIIASEPSGDWQGGALGEALRQSGVPLDMYGVGGSCMREVGIELWQDTQDCACIGPGDAIWRLGFFYRSFFRIQKELLKLKPDLTIMIDSPALNMRMAKFLRRHNLRSLYYIPPSAWTKSEKRLRDIHERVDGIVCIFKYNAERYAKLGLPVAFYGHPIADMYSSDDGGSLEEMRKKLNITDDALAVLPGSRKQEVRYLLPAFVDIAEKFIADRPGVNVIIPGATDELYAHILNYLGDSHPRFKVVRAHTRDILRLSRVCLTTSGSATLEATMCGIPMAICYKFGLLNSYLGRFLIFCGLLKVEHFGLPNLVVNKRICPELLQEEVCAETLLPILNDLWEDTPERRKMLEDLAKVRESLGNSGVIYKVARTALNMAKGISFQDAIVRD